MAHQELKQRLHEERVDRQVTRILENDQSRLGDQFYECVGIDSATGKLIRFNSQDLDEGRSQYADIVDGKAQSESPPS